MSMVFVVANKAANFLIVLFKFCPGGREIAAIDNWTIDGVGVEVHVAMVGVDIGVVFQPYGVW